MLIETLTAPERDTLELGPQNHYFFMEPFSLLHALGVNITLGAWMPVLY